MVALDAVEAPGSKLYLSKLREFAQKHLDKAGPNYPPLDLNRLTPKTFLDYLLSLSDIKKNEYMKSHGGYRSALTQLYTQCEIAPTKVFLQKMKQVMSGLKNTSATPDAIVALDSAKARSLYRLKCTENAMHKPAPG